MSVFSANALPGGADITVIADPVSAAQRVALAHGSPLPLRLQRALQPSAQHAAKASTTAFSVPQGRRVAHVKLPKVCALMPLQGSRVGAGSMNAARTRLFTSCAINRKFTICMCCRVRMARVAAAAYD